MVQQQQPNVLVLLPDQLRADFVGAYGATGLETPHMDRLANEGVRYADAMSVSPLCVPARTSLMTGAHALRNGTLTTFHGLRPDYHDAGLHTLPELLNDVGYATSAVGKMHFYSWDARLGFQRRVIAEDKRWTAIADDYHHFLADRGLRKLRGDEHDGYAENFGAVVSPLPIEASPDAFVASEAVKIIEQSAGQTAPFAMVVGFPGPHCPYDPVPSSLERVDPDTLPAPVGDGTPTATLRDKNVRSNRGAWNGVDYAAADSAALRKLRHHYAALVVQIDDAVGQIIDALERTGQLDNTVIVLSSDHGDYLGDHGMVGKQGFHEATVRVPLIVRPPGGCEPIVDHHLVDLRDVTATALAYAGVDRQPWMDAQPLPNLGHDGQSEHRTQLFGALPAGWMLYDGQFKLHAYRTGEVALFDLRADPDEEHDVSGVAQYQRTLRDLFGRATSELMGHLDAAFVDRTVVGEGPLYLDEAFAQEGWRRTFPQAPGA